MKNLLKDPGFWVYIGIFALFFAAIINMKPKKDCQYKELPTDKEIEKIEGI